MPYEIMTRVSAQLFDAVVVGGEPTLPQLSIYTSPKTELQAQRQAQALQQNGLRGRWEVPTAAEAAARRTCLTSWASARAQGRQPGQYLVELATRATRGL